MEMYYVPRIILEDDYIVLNAWERWGVYDDKLDGLDALRKLQLEVKTGVYDSYLSEKDREYEHTLDAVLGVYSKETNQLIYHLTLPIEKRDLTFVPVVIHYDYRKDTEVILCVSEKEAMQTISDEYHEFARNAIDEFDGYISEDGRYAKLTLIDSKDGSKLTTEWSIGSVYEKKRR